MQIALEFYLFNEADDDEMGSGVCVCGGGMLDGCSPPLRTSMETGRGNKKIIDEYTKRNGFFLLLYIYKNVEIIIIISKTLVVEMNAMLKSKKKGNDEDGNVVRRNFM